VQQLIEDGEDKIVALVVNDKYTWRRAVTAVIGEWFDLVIGWNIQDGIAMKINNKKVSGSVNHLIFIFDFASAVSIQPS